MFVSPSPRTLEWLLRRDLTFRLLEHELQRPKVLIDQVQHDLLVHLLQFQALSRQ